MRQHKGPGGVIVVFLLHLVIYQFCECQLQKSAKNMVHLVVRCSHV